MSIPQWDTHVTKWVWGVIAVQARDTPLARRNSLRAIHEGSEMNETKAKRYAVECDTPDKGRSTYAECWGRGGARGRTLYESDSLAECIQFCGGSPATATAAVTPWIWDRRTGRVVGEKRIAELQSA